MDLKFANYCLFKATCTCTVMHVCIRAPLPVVCIPVYVYVCVCVCVHVRMCYMCVYMHVVHSDYIFVRVLVVYKE